MPAHSDWGTITMLFQDDCGGLQVEDPNQEGHFVDATPMANALVMNVGDLLMRWSNGLPPATRLLLASNPCHYLRASILYLIVKNRITRLFYSVFIIIRLLSMTNTGSRLPKIDPASSYPPARVARQRRDTSDDALAVLDSVLCCAGPDGSD